MRPKPDQVSAEARRLDDALETKERGARRIVYVSFEGMLEPLGASQVVPFIEGLSEHGFEYAIVSLERERDVRDDARVEAMRHRLARHGVEWVPIVYQQGGASDAGRNILHAVATVADLLDDRDVHLVHARGYQATIVACLVNLLFGTPYLFDTRGFWIDERVEDGKWFNTPTRYAIGKWLERQLYARSAGAMSLTRLGADEIEAGRFGAWPKTRPLEVVPTSVDERRFARIPREELPPHVRPFVDRLVVGFVGSINSSYRVDESLRLFRMILELEPNAHLLCLTRQQDEMRARLRAAGVPDEAVTVQTAPYERMVEWLSVMDWGLLILNETFAKRASMPTKLGEFFACGVRPIQYGCNPEVAHWVREYGEGIVLDDVSDAGLRRAAQHVVESKPSSTALAQGRARVMRHFGLRPGIEKYAEMLHRVLQAAT